MSQLTTRVLATARGCPAANMSLELWAVERQSVKSGYRDKQILYKNIH